MGRSPRDCCDLSIGGASLVLSQVEFGKDGVVMMSRNHLTSLT